MANVYDSSGPGQAGDGPRFDDSGLSDQYTDLTQLVTERLTSLAAGLVQSLRAHPLIVAVAAAAGVGALAGIWMARRTRSRAERLQDALGRPTKAVGKGAERARETGKRLRRAADYGELIPLALRLLENPLVRAYLVQAFARRVAKRFE